MKWNIIDKNNYKKPYDQNVMTDYVMQKFGFIKCSGEFKSTAAHFVNSNEFK